MLAKCITHPQLRLYNYGVQFIDGFANVSNGQAEMLRDLQQNSKGKYQFEFPADIAVQQKAEIKTDEVEKKETKAKKG